MLDAHLSTTPVYTPPSETIHHALVTMPIILLTLLRRHSNHIINAEDRQCSLSGRTQGTDLGQSRLQHSSMDVITDLALDQIQSIPLQSLARRVLLGSVMVHTELRHQICRVLGCIYSQRLGDHKQCVRKLCNRQLLTRALLQHIKQKNTG